MNHGGARKGSGRKRMPLMKKMQEQPIISDGRILIRTLIKWDCR